MSQTAPQRTIIVYFVSESTAITAQTLGNSLLSQFEDVHFDRHYMPYIDTLDKARLLVEELEQVKKEHGDKPLLFATMPDKEIDTLFKNAPCHYFELFSGYLKQIAEILNIRPSYKFGLSHGMRSTSSYDKRMDTVNYSLNHDDGVVLDDLDQADVILVGVSRSGKTPTSLYLAMHFDIRTANYPITEDDFEKGKLPKEILQNKSKLLGMTIDPFRLHEIREKRRPQSKYSALKTCQNDVIRAQEFFLRYNIPVLDSTARSIEEIASQIVRETGIIQH